jgi:hypothetical protein
MRSSPPPSETSSIASNTPSNLNQYPNDWKCLHLKIQSWFYASLGTLCCFCTIRIADYILTLIYIQSSIGKSDSSNSLSRFHGILAFDVLQVLSVILLGTYGTYRMNSKLIVTYLMVQVSFLAVNSVLLVYWIMNIWPDSDEDKVIDCDNQRATFELYKRDEKCGLSTQTNISTIISSISCTDEQVQVQLCVCDNYLKGLHKSSILCMQQWSELLLTLANTTSCTGTLIFGALVLRMSYMVKNKNPVGGRTNRPTRQHPHNQYPHNQLLDESMTNVDEDSSNYDSQYS